MPPSLPAKSVFGRRLREAREKRGLSQTDLGLDALDGVEQHSAASRISKYERGVNFPKFETIEQLAKALDIPPAYLLTTSDDLAQLIWSFCELPPDRRREALKLVQALAKQAGAKPAKSG